jgi:hypothetical protein
MLYYTLEIRMKYYHALVHTTLVSLSDGEAEKLASAVADDIQKIGGTITVGRNFGEAPAILILTLPDDTEFKPDELIGGVSWTEVHATQFAAPEVKE